MDLPPEVIWTLGGVFGLLVVASLIVAALRYFRPQSASDELVARTVTWWVIVLMFAGSLVVSRSAALFFFAFVSFLALKEFLSIIPTRRADRRVLFWAYLAIPFQYYWIYQDWYGLFLVFIPVYLFLWIPARMVMIGETSGFLRAIGTVHWGLMTTVFSLSHAAYLLVLQPSGSARLDPDWPASGVGRPGPGLVLLLILLTQMNDVAQFVWGKSLGNRRIAPKVSPGKTLAGLLGGVGTTTLIAWLLGPRLTLMDDAHSLVAGLLIGLTGVAGDLSISALKRDLQIKDSGSILPGHGGILDRIDSLTYTAPLFFHYVYFSYF